MVSKPKIDSVGAQQFLSFKSTPFGQFGPHFHQPSMCPGLGLPKPARQVGPVAVFVEVDGEDQYRGGDFQKDLMGIGGIVDRLPGECDIIVRSQRSQENDEASFCQKQSKRLTRAIAAWLARRTTEATLRELAAPLGLTHLDSVRNLLHQADAAIERSAKLRKEVAHLRQSILHAQHKLAPLTANKPQHAKIAVRFPGD